ncbi:MAG: hypothetical protein ABI895_17325 [Deltaproteobacteria bacterium]
MAILEEGANYRVELNGNVAVCSVWSRPDLDCETGAQLAAQKVVICRSLAAGQALGLIFDLREAPKVTGPKTQKSLELIMGAWQAAARPIAIIVSPASMQKLQLTRIARDAAPQHAEVFTEFELGRQWLERRLQERRRGPQNKVVQPVEGAPGRSIPAAATGAQPSLPAGRAGSVRAGAIKRRS